MDEKKFLQRKIFLKWQGIDLLLHDIWELENQLDELEKEERNLVEERCHGSD